MEEIKGTEKTERARNWVTILYSEELNEGWRKKLEDMCVPACLSPLHTPNDKKPHYHLLISGDKKTESQIMAVFAMLTEWVEIDGKKSLKGIARPQRVVNLRSTVRYFLHLDNPKKQQFDLSKEGLTDFGGFDSSKYLLDENAKKKEKYVAVKGVIKIIRDKRFDHIIDLLDYLAMEGEDDLFTVVCDNAYLCTQLVSKYKARENPKSVLNIAKEALL